MRESTEAELPDDLQALLWACHCFGLGEEELRIYRMKLHRAHADDDISPKERESVCQRLLQSLREAIQTPISHATFLTDPLVTDLLQLYSKIRPHLKIKKVSRMHALWVLTEHVLVPTAHLIVRQKHGLGLGTEFLADSCWYVPERDGAKVRKPVQRVLDCWLRVAGLRTDYRVSKEIGSDAVRRKVNRWLEGKNQPTLEDLHRLVDEFAAKVAWLDEPDSWKARFTLACAVQRVWNNVDTFFQPVNRTPSLMLAKDFRDLAAEPLYQDTRGSLTQTCTFFAVRLLQSRLERTGELERIIAPAWKERRGKFGLEVPDEEIERWKRQAEWEGNPANWFLAFIQKKAVAAKRIQLDGDPIETEWALRKFLFELGIQELNRLLRV